MTEQEWLVCKDAQPMLEHLWKRVCEGKATISERKARLLACAFCRKFYHLLKDQRSRDALDAAEAFADGLIRYEAFKKGARSALDPHLEALFAFEKLSQKDDRTDAYLKIIGSNAASLAMLDPDPKDGHLLRWAISAVGYVVAGFENYKSADNEQAFIIRDIFGPPCFRSVSFGRSWRTPRTVSLAQKVYEARAMDQMPILADELAKAGCANPEILGHCREPGPHVKGCWAVDLVLGKE